MTTENATEHTTETPGAWRRDAAALRVGTVLRQNAEDIRGGESYRSDPRALSDFADGLFETIDADQDHLFGVWQEAARNVLDHDWPALGEPRWNALGWRATMDVILAVAEILGVEVES